MVVLQVEHKVFPEELAPVDTISLRPPLACPLNHLHRGKRSQDQVTGLHALPSAAHRSAGTHTRRILSVHTRAHTRAHEIRIHAQAQTQLPPRNTHPDPCKHKVVSSQTQATQTVLNTHTAHTIATFTRAHTLQVIPT